jgi:hypothetical protein
MRADFIKRDRSSPAQPLAPGSELHGLAQRWVYKILQHKVEVIAMDSRMIRLPIKCPCCGQESTMLSRLDTVVDALVTGGRLKLSSECAHHRVTWVADEIERNQIRECAVALRFALSEQLQRPRRYASELH